jgi:hypothetical protein
LYSSFGNGDGLLFHGFMDCDLITNVHFVKLVNGTDAVVGEHERTSFDGELASLFVFDNGGRETGSGGGFARGVDCSGEEGAYVSVRMVRGDNFRAEKDAYLRN